MKHHDPSNFMSTHLTHRGGDWLLGDTPAADVFTPETLSDEHRLIRQTAAEFVAGEVFPALDELEKRNWGRARELMKRAGDLGLIGTDVPERVGGVGLDKVAAIVVGEEVGACAAFATTFGAQTGLAIIPILCFGTPAQQQKYLPRLVSGDILGAYCLSESGSGSDALGARARATRQPDGSFLLNGEKMWITNGGFADLFVVFCKVDGDQFTALLVERGWGVKSGKEEHKMGLHGSSTTPLLLADARVPAENLLGEIGKGHKIAFNVLNYGRFKLAAMCTGGAKLAMAEAAAYASTRRQFGQPIASFGAIRHKLAEMTVRCYGVESMLYRTAGLVDEAIGSSGSDAAVVAGALEEFAIESSLLKVAGSEMIGFVADENVQIHGGNGFVRDYSAERHYRDVRVDRIFEGTNEINRLLVPGMLIKRALKGGLPLIAAARALQDELLTPRSPAGLGSVGTTGDSGDPLAVSRHTVQAMKKTALMVLGLAMQTYGDKITDEQEVVMMASDAIMAAFAAESATLRAERAAHARDPLAALHADAASVLAHDAGLATDALARTAIAAMASGDEQRTMLAALKRILKVGPINTVAARRRIADAVTEKKGYIFA
jgi:alkylation response protein AidB-like acyl-CoA dehydrogenase